MASQKLTRFTELEDWLRNSGMKQAELARRIDEPKSVINRLILGGMRRLDPSLISKIANATGGGVGMSEFANFFQRLSDAA